MSLWIYPDTDPGLHAGPGILSVADGSLSREISPVCEVNSGLNEEKHQHLSACYGYMSDFVLLLLPSLF